VQIEYKCKCLQLDFVAKKAVLKIAIRGDGNDVCVCFFLFTIMLGSHWVIICGSLWHKSKVFTLCSTPTETAVQIFGVTKNMW